jgi:hypothetical protein
VQLTICPSHDSPGGVVLSIRPRFAPPKRQRGESDEDRERAKQVWAKVDALLGSYHLSKFGFVIAKKWLRKIADPSERLFDRLRPWVIDLLNGRRRSKPASPWQSGCPELLPKLRAQPVWGSSTLPWLAAFEERAAEIREELLRLRGQRGFQPLRIPAWASRNAVDSTDGHGQLSHDSGDWNVFYLHLHEVRRRIPCCCCCPCCCCRSRFALEPLPGLLALLLLIVGPLCCSCQTAL